MPLHVLACCGAYRIISATHHWPAHSTVDKRWFRFSPPLLFLCLSLCLSQPQTIRPSPAGFVQSVAFVQRVAASVLISEQTHHLLQARTPGSQTTRYGLRYGHLSCCKQVQPRPRDRAPSSLSQNQDRRRVKSYPRLKLERVLFLLTPIPYEFGRLSELLL